MNDALLVQHVSENAPHANMLKVTASRNIEYCLRHKFDFELIISGDTDEVIRYGDWHKVRLLRTALELPYKYIVWLDADTVIVDMAHDLREGCPPGKIGACRHVLAPPRYRISLDHLNVGTLFISNCDTTKRFFDKWLAGYPGTSAPPWWEQGVFNAINDGTVVAIDDKYNATADVNPSPNPVVRGFHGQGDVWQRFNMMCDAIRK